jgi:hypothetical protein
MSRNFPREDLTWSKAIKKGRFPPDLVVKSQTIDITGGVLSLIRRPKGVQTLHRNRKSRLELLFLSEAH